MNKLIRSEWIKFRSLRFHWGLLAFGAVVNVVLLVLGLVFFNNSLGDQPADTGIDARINAVLSPMTAFATILGILGVMAMSSEYKAKTVIPSFAVAPIRSEVVAAKAAVVALVGLVTAALVLVVDCVAGLITLDAKGFPVELGDDHFIQAAGGSLIYVVLVALFGFGLGVLIKNAVLSVTLIIAIPLVAEPALAGFLPDWIDRYLPFGAGSALFTPGGTEQLTAWEGGGVLGLWALVLILVAGAVFERRDLGNTA